MFQVRGGMCEEPAAEAPLQTGMLALQTGMNALRIGMRAPQTGMSAVGSRTSPRRGGTFRAGLAIDRGSLALAARLDGESAVASQLLENPVEHTAIRLIPSTRASVTGKRPKRTLCTIRVECTV
jgi:hypothetical protein